MSSIFYPVLPSSCPWGTKGACRFCGIPFMEKVLTDTMPDDAELRQQFEKFISDKQNTEDIERHGRIAIPPNGSVVPGVPRTIRSHIHDFCQKRGLTFKSEFIATLINPHWTRDLYRHALSVQFPDISKQNREERMRHILDDIDRALNEDFQKSNVLLNMGLEVANSDDLATLNNYTTNLDDYIACATFLHERDIRVGANVLLGAPIIEHRVEKALRTIRFAFDTLRADKTLLIVWIPTKHTVAKALYDQGKIDVLSATEAAEIYRIAREHYPEKEIEYNAMRCFLWHGRHPNFHTSKISTEEERERARTHVRTIAEDVFTSPGSGS